MNKTLKNHGFYKPCVGRSENKNDFHRIEWGKDRFAGFQIGKTSFPVFFTADGNDVHLQDSARGASVMIVTNKANVKGAFGKAHTWGISEACNFCKPNIATIFNNVHLFDNLLFDNPSILKIFPIKIANDIRSDKKAMYHSANTFYFRRHSSCSAFNITKEQTIWYDETNSDDDDDLRMVLNVISIIQLAYILGYRRIFVNKLDWPDTESLKLQNANKCIEAFKQAGVEVSNCGQKAGEIRQISTKKAFKEVFNN